MPRGYPLPRGTGAVASLGGAPSLGFVEDEGVLVAFGEERMSVEIRVIGTSSSTTLRKDDLECDASPHTIKIPVQSVAADAVSADGTGAWSVAVHGQQR